MPTRVQASPKGLNPTPQNTVSTTFTTPPAIGNTVIVVLWNSVGALLAPPSDTRGHAYASLLGGGNATIPASIAVYGTRVVATGAPFTITSADAGAGVRMIQAIEITPARMTNAHFSQSASLTAASPTLGNAGSVFTVGVVCAVSGAFTVSASTPAWVEESEEVAAVVRGELDTREATTGSQVVSWTLDTSTTWLAGIVAFLDDLPPPTTTGHGPIARLPGKVTATNALDVSTTAALAAATQTAHLDGPTQYTDAILIPAPAAGAQILVTALSASALVAGPFAAHFRTGAATVLGPIWLPSSGALVSGRTFSTGPILRALPPGQGLTVTTSADAPQSFDAEYQIVSVGA